MKRAGTWQGLVAAAAVSIALLIGRGVLFAELVFGYMIWNLLLAAIPFVLGVILVNRLDHSRWSSPLNMLLTLLWLGFLPNSFYVVTDLIHLARVPAETLLFDSVMLLSFALTGLLLGYASVLMIHRQLLSRHRTQRVNIALAVIFLACSYAIYLGRYMRWNTWDVIINPLGLLANITDSLVNPRHEAPVIQTTVLFFIFLSSFYLVVLRLWPQALTPKASRSHNLGGNRGSQKRPKRVK